jgi:hypothetical protein
MLGYALGICLHFTHRPRTHSQFLLYITNSSSKVNPEAMGFILIRACEVGLDFDKDWLRDCPKCEGPSDVGVSKNKMPTQQKIMVRNMPSNSSRKIL